MWSGTFGFSVFRRARRKTVLTSRSRSLGYSSRGRTQDPCRSGETGGNGCGVRPHRQFCAADWFLPRRSRHDTARNIRSNAAGAPSFVACSRGEPVATLTVVGLLERRRAQANAGQGRVQTSRIGPRCADVHRAWLRVARRTLFVCRPDACGPACVVFVCTNAPDQVLAPLSLDRGSGNNRSCPKGHVPARPFSCGAGGHGARGDLCVLRWRVSVE